MILSKTIERSVQINPTKSRTGSGQMNKVDVELGRYAFASVLWKSSAYCGLNFPRANLRCSFFNSGNLDWMK
jgi:hypothetical protein